MINRNQIEKYLSDIEYAKTQYQKADFAIFNAKNDAIEEIRKIGTENDATKDILNAMMVSVEEHEFTKKWARKEICDKKQSLIDLIQNIEEPRKSSIYD